MNTRIIEREDLLQEVKDHRAVLLAFNPFHERYEMIVVDDIEFTAQGGVQAAHVVLGRGIMERGEA